MQHLLKIMRINNMSFYLYTLAHPITKEIRYIGKTNNLTLRYNRHCSPEDQQSHRISWLKSLKSKGLRPLMEVLEEFNCEDTCYESEIYWIAQFKIWGFDLVNTHEGGRTSYSNPMSEETKLKVSQTLRERYSKQEHHLKNKPHTKEQKKQRSNRLKGIKPSCSFKGKKHGKSVRKSVEVYKNNILIDTLDSVFEASIKYNVNAGSISNVCLGKAKTAKGYTFKYLQ